MKNVDLVKINKDLKTAIRDNHKLIQQPKVLEGVSVVLYGA